MRQARRCRVATVLASSTGVNDSSAVGGLALGGSDAAGCRGRRGRRARLCAVLDGVVRSMVFTSVSLRSCCSLMLRRSASTCCLFERMKIG